MIQYCLVATQRYYSLEVLPDSLLKHINVDSLNAGSWSKSENASLYTGPRI